MRKARPLFRTILFLTGIFYLLIFSGSAGCGRTYPSYSGVYRLKSSQLPEIDPAIAVSFPKKLEVIQYPFVLYNGQVSTRMTVGAKLDQGSTVFFNAAPLNTDPDTSLSYSVVPGEILSDPKSVPILDRDGKDLGYSCRYAYGAEARFVFGTRLDAFTHETQGVYPRLELQKVGGREELTRPPGQWSDRPIRYEVWDAQSKELTVYFAIYRKSVYGNLGTCSYRDSPIPKEDTAFTYIATYVLESEQGDVDPRVEIDDAQVQTQVKAVLGTDLSSAWESTFIVPDRGAELKGFFGD